MTATHNHLVVRADASPSLGGGHIMRTMTLAKVLMQRGWAVTFAATSETLTMVNAMGLNDFATVSLPDAHAHDSQALIEAIHDGCNTVLIDHYALDQNYERPLRGWAQKIVVIDDLANRSHECDLLIDQTYGRSSDDYRSLVPTQCRILTGTDHALLRPEFAELRQSSLRRRDSASDVRRIIVLPGMSDPKNLTSVVLDGIILSGLDLSIDVVMGSTSPYLNSVAAQINHIGRNAKLHIDCQDVASLMARADLAIGASGTTAWERCCLGLPTLAIITADNQNVIATTLAQANISQNLGLIEKLKADDIATAIKEHCQNATSRRSMINASACACDGLGAARTSIAFDPPRDLRGRAVTTRTVTRDDCKLILAWQREPGMRRYFNTPQAPTQTEHEAWFEKKLTDPLCVFEITLVNGHAAGVLRLDASEKQDNTYEVSILIATAYQGCSVASASLKNARRLLPHATFKAEVHPDNTASEKSFLSAGYMWQKDILVSEPE